MLEITNLTKCYGQQTILDNLSLQAKGSQIIGLVGNNGSGKTTLLKCISRLIPNYQGNIQLEGSLSFSIENPTFFDNLTVEANLETFACLANNQHELSIEQVLEKVKLQDARHKKFKQLSLGMKQKLSLARILMVNHDIILLDEPFNGLDILTKQQLKELIVSLRSQGKLIIVSSHILEELGEICDTIWYLKKRNIRSTVNLHDENRIYTVKIRPTTEGISYIKKTFQTNFKKDSQGNILFKIPLANQRIPEVLQDLIHHKVKVIEYLDTTNDIRDLMVEEEGEL